MYEPHSHTWPPPHIPGQMTFADATDMEQISAGGEDAKSQEAETTETTGRPGGSPEGG